MKPYPSYKPSGVPWLGEIPEHWGLKRLKFHAEQVGEKTSEPSAGIAYVGLEHIESGTGKFISSLEGTQTEAESTVSHFRVGDVLFGKLRPYLAKAVIAYGDGVCTTELLVLRPHSTDSGYLLRSLLLDGFIKTVDASTFGAKMPRADWTFIGNLLLPDPPMKEQQAIAAYLDREATRIDTLIAEKVLLIDTLREYRQATISEVVTQGLDSAAPKKPSGVPWLGEVPAHWEVRRLKSLLNEPLIYGANEAADGDEPGNPRFVRITDMNDNGCLREETFRSLPLDLAKPYLLIDGDVLLARSGATVGKSFLYDGSWGSCCFAGYLIRARFNQDVFMPKFFYACCQSTFYWQYVSGTQIQSTIQNLNAEKYANLWLPCPPIDEQQTIAVYLDRETARIDKLLEHVRDEIKLLQELRAATITDAVTGKIQVS